MVLASVVSAAVLFTGLFAIGNAGAAEPIKGSMVAYNTAIEKKKCNPKKGKAKVKCVKSAKARGIAVTRKMMSTPDGLYGFGIKQAAIPARNGTLIWSKALAPTDGAARTDFVLYSSKSYPRNGKAVVSGTVSYPEGKAPKGGWPVISWAHGTTGLADSCAPSKGGDQGSYGGAELLIKAWLEDGYAVVATDYEGLGTPTVHPYLQGTSEGRGVLDIVRAARMLSPSLSRNVVIAGHSQGGHAALFAAGLATGWANDFAHKGTVAYAPANSYLQQIPLLNSQPGAYGLSALATSILRGAVISDSGIVPADILSEDALALYPEVEEICYGELADRFTEEAIGPEALLKAGWQTTESGQKFLEVLGEMDPVVKTNRKVLITQGLQDTTVLPLSTNALVPALATENPGLIEYIKYGKQQGLNTPNVLLDTPSTHGSILADAKAEVDGFLVDAFAP